MTNAERLALAAMTEALAAVEALAHVPQGTLGRASLRLRSEVEAILAEQPRPTTRVRGFRPR